MFAVPRGVFAAGDGPVLVGPALAAPCQMGVLVVTIRYQPLGSLSAAIGMGDLPAPSVKIADCARRRNLNRNIIAASVIAMAAQGSHIFGLAAVFLGHFPENGLLALPGTFRLVADSQRDDVAGRTEPPPCAPPLNRPLERYPAGALACRLDAALPQTLPSAAHRAAMRGSA